MAKQNNFVCPECGRKFGRAQALGAHRSRAHGVAGTSRATKSDPGKGVPVFPVFPVPDTDVDDERAFNESVRETALSEPSPLSTTLPPDGSSFGESVDEWRELTMQELISPANTNAFYRFSLTTRMDRDEALALARKLEAMVEQMLDRTGVRVYVGIRG